MQTASHTSDPIHPWPLIALAGWVLPGLGHALCGHTRRGVIVGSVLLGLFFGGILIGGIDVVDRRRDTLWFAGQAMLGPVAFAADYAHQRLDARRQEQVDQYADEHRSPNRNAALTEMIERDIPLAYGTSIAKANELGTLYCTLAGVMNLLVVLDAVGRTIESSKFQVSSSKIQEGRASQP